MQVRTVFITDETVRDPIARWPEVNLICAGCRVAAGLDSDGNIHYDYMSHRPYEFRLRDAYWKDLKALAADRYNPGVLLGLKRDGTCILSKDPFAGWTSGQFFSRTKADNPAFTALRSFVHSLRSVEQIAVSGTMFLALDSSGRLHARPYVGLTYGSPFHADSLDRLDELAAAVSAWENVRRILLAEPYLIIAQKRSGEILCGGQTSDLYGTFGKKNLAELQSLTLTDACGYYGGESMHFAFLDDSGLLHCPRYPKTEDRFLQVEGLDHTFIALREDGRIVAFQDGFDGIARQWPAMRQISLGRRDPSRYDDLFLMGIPLTE